HKTNPMDTLNKYKIYNMFDNIIHIGKDEKKSEYIEEKDSIFIDDSFSERKDVYDNKNIPVFDVNMIDVLL
ncbi:MAG: carbamoylphosphate synthase large subunit short form, partial [Bacilli bacterium]|nr:carbamoylphosphate synthase large subunit short form [Bacilli bacterium]